MQVAKNSIYSSHVIVSYSSESLVCVCVGLGRDKVYDPSVPCLLCGNQLLGFAPRYVGKGIVGEGLLSV